VPRLTIFTLALLLLPVAPALAQASIDPCALVPQNDIATLMSLNQAELTAQPSSDLNRLECSYDLQSPLRAVGSATLRLSLYPTQAEALHRLHTDHPFDKPSTLVKTADPADVVVVFSTDPPQVAAVHNNHLVEWSISSAENSAKANPTWAYRMQRTALIAAGATILPQPGLSPDPVAPQRQSAAPDVVRYTGKPHLIDQIRIQMPFLVPVAIMIVGLFFFPLYGLRGWSSSKRIRENGVPGNASIRAISDTGTTINNDPMVRYHVTITSQLGPPYEASTKVVVSRLTNVQSQIGKTLPVKIDPRNPQKFIFDPGA
jgi:hypothetical protein